MRNTSNGSARLIGSMLGWGHQWNRIQEEECDWDPGGVTERFWNFMAKHHIKRDAPGIELIFRCDLRKLTRL